MDLEKQISRILKKYTKKEENIIQCQRLFVANSVLRWVVENIKDKEKIIYYLKEAEKHLSGEITLYWQDDTIKVKREKK
jgi:hypothetical protein